MWTRLASSDIEVFLLRKPGGGAGGDCAEIPTGQPPQSLSGHGVIQVLVFSLKTKSKSFESKPGSLGVLLGPFDFPIIILQVQ